MRTKNQTSTTRKKKGVASSARTLTLARVPAGQLRRLLKPRIGYEEFVELFEKLVAKYGAELGAGIDVDVIRTSVQNVQSLQPALADAREQVALFENTQAVQSSNGWKEMLLVYGRALQVTRTNSQIEIDLEPFTKFMKSKPRAKKPATTPAG